MNLTKHKRWRVLLPRLIAKQQAEKEQTHSVYLHTVDKYENVENINTQSDYKTTSKRWIDKIKAETCSLCLVNVFKFQENKFKIIQKNF